MKVMLVVAASHNKAVSLFCSHSIMWVVLRWRGRTLNVGDAEQAGKARLRSASLDRPVNRSSHS